MDGTGTKRSVHSVRGSGKKRLIGFMGNACRGLSVWADRPLATHKPTHTVHTVQQVYTVHTVNTRYQPFTHWRLAGGYGTDR